MKKIFGFVIVLLFAFSASAENHETHGEEGDHENAEKPAFNASAHAVHHALDAHEFHFTDGLIIPLPVILWTDKGLVTFMSSEFHHKADGSVVEYYQSDNGSVVVSRKGLNFVKVHETIYQLEADATFAELHDGHLENGSKVWMDFSLTKNVVTIFLIAFLLLLVFLKSAKRYRKGDKEKAPSGIAAWTEPIILFVRGIAKDNIEGEKYKKFTPYLLTVFFFILFGNVLGLIPFLANPNVTGSISITLLLTMFTFGIQMINSKKNYWGHIFTPPGVPIALYPILIPIEIAGIFIKPAALMIRLFANITAGHIIVVSLISIIFVNEVASEGTGIYWSALSVPFTLFISLLEILVAILQAYIFTMLSALFIGMAVETAHH